MKKIFYAVIGFALFFFSCTKQQLADAYADPSKISSTSLDRQFAGMEYSNMNYVMYKYWQYFVVYQNTVIPWTQTSATLNTPGRYIPGVAATTDLWSAFYGLTAQYREVLKVYNAMSTADQATNRMYVIAATIYFYDFTQKVVDAYGSIPWSQAGMLSTNGGDYKASLAKYDDAATIYATMLDDLKKFADELSTITIPTSVSATMNTQDFVNHGDLTAWKRYCNSLRMKLLTRISGVSSSQSRYTSEMASILGDATKYPVVDTYDQSIMVKVTTLSSPINNGTGTGNSADFYTGLIGWGRADRAGKAMIDHMNTNTDPRLRVMFEPGETAGTVYSGLDPSLTSTQQNTILDAGTIARYNRSTFTQNLMLPGMLINAAEVKFMAAEYYMKAGNDAAAKTAYEAGITQSINYMYWARSITTNTVAGTYAPLAATEVTNYLNATGIKWTGTNTEKIAKIATQKWINYNVLQPLEAWAEYRRLKLPALQFVADAGIQSLPPNRWLYPTNEATYNTSNYEAVKANDNLNSKIFWQP